MKKKTLKKPNNSKAPVKAETDNQDSLVATTDKTILPKMFWDEEKKALTVWTDSPDDWLKSMGATDEDMANMLSTQLINSNRDGQEANKVVINGTIAMYRGIEPQDSVDKKLRVLSQFHLLLCLSPFY